MPKVKTNSGAKKRFTFTGTGKIKRRHAYKSHILTKKSKKRKRNLGKIVVVDKANLNSIRELLVKKWLASKLWPQLNLLKNFNFLLTEWPALRAAQTTAADIQNK